MQRQYREQPGVNADRVEVSLRHHLKDELSERIMQVAQIRSAEETLNLHGDL